ncbi:apolipoprotein N-acyltransferase [Deinococcus peraridilitoris]|uniref:Apolipoprotein N-acyltransferase n=1 Tax=Deinococcus peraridilitoris (strain DSM 19664 / LMG 22246 / CIP 109416 / KR-200) TaxID=937777 RepID=L0A5L9_DEIPD|nr:apolipoprotein N-acyltransferase [Deinococcus peraridilitoris]AFZ69136.1 apolipoprotein N-acyltransferase [Deinococcus peraridilitoris DSM 19664]
MPSALIALALGALLAACGIPFAWSFLTPVVLGVLFAFAAGAPTSRGAAARLFWAGLAFFTLTLYWLPQSFGTGFGIFGVLMFVPLYALEAFFWGVLGWASWRLGSRTETRLWLLAFLWVVLEWLRHLGQIAFPWGTVGYTLLPLPVVQIADLGGVLLLSLLVSTTAAVLALALRGHTRPLLGAVVVWSAAVAYGLTRPELTGEPGRALLLRTNVNSFEKAKGAGSSFESQFEAQMRLSRQIDPGEVLVWSETAVFVHPDFDQRTLLPRREMITGVGFPQRNSAVSWNGAILGEYDKMQLVPFGEFYPWREPLRPAYAWIWSRLLGVPFNPPNPGRAATPLPLGPHAYGTYICYDSVFPGVTRGLVGAGAEVLVNVSNDGWYDESLGVEQHFQMGRLRAIETRRYVMRSVNLGVAAVVDERGRVRQRFSGPGEEALHARFQYLRGTTPFVRFGNGPVLALCVLGLLASVLVDRLAGRAPR